MADLVGIATSALRSTQLSLSTTGNNIANVNTEGYSRQRAELVNLLPQGASGRQIGSGVTVDSIQRSHDAFVATEIQHLRAGTARHESINNLSSRINSLFSNPDTNLSVDIQEFFSAAQDVANSPTTVAERQVMLGEAQALAVKQKTIYSSLTGLEKEVNQRLEASVAAINSLASSIAEVNQQMAGSGSNDSSPAVLDRRDQLLNQLSEETSLRVNEKPDGSVDLFIGNGHALVVGNQIRELALATDRYQATRLNVVAADIGNSDILNDKLTSGRIGGLLEFREDVLDPAIEQLGLMSMALTREFNAQHQLGIDMNAQPGGNFFKETTIQPLPNTDNSQSDLPAVTVDNTGDLKADSYRLHYQGGWILSRASDGFSTSGAGVLQLDGLNVDTTTITGASNGDSYLIQASRNAAAEFDLELSNVREIAAANAVHAETELGNSGDLAIDEMQLTDPSAIPLQADVTLTFNSTIPGFDVSYTGPLPISTTVSYDPATQSDGHVIQLGPPGLAIQVSGIPDDGDSLSIRDGNALSGDNRNALALVDIQQQQLVDGEAATLTDVYSRMVSDLAIVTANSGDNLAVNQALLTQVEDHQAGVAGVNLDEEAAALIRFQHQYRAAAQLIAAADMIFSTLLATTQPR